MVGSISGRKILQNLASSSLKPPKDESSLAEQADGTETGGGPRSAGGISGPKGLLRVLLVGLQKEPVGDPSTKSWVVQGDGRRSKDRRLGENSFPVHDRELRRTVFMPVHSFFDPP